MKNNPITILTLFAGRWHTWEPYLHGLLNLYWPDKKDIRLLWFTNAQEQFVTFLKEQRERLLKMGYAGIELISDSSLPPAYRVFHEGHQRSGEHLNAITALYNAAWQYVKTNDVLFLEDDIIVPSHALRRLSQALEQNQKAVLVSSCVFDRHNQGVVFIWDVVDAPVSVNGKVRMGYVLVPVGQPWGVRKVSCAGFSCSLIRRSRIAKQVYRPFPFKGRNPIKGMAHIGGCDVVFCLENKRYGREVYADYDVRPYHVDSQAKIH